MPVQTAVLIPGIMGTELFLRDRLIWPGPPESLIFKYKLMSELMKPDLDIGGLIRSFSVSEQYQSLIDDLGTCGFNEGDDTLCLCPYDWRKKNELAAERLAEKIELLTERRGGDLEITLVAHSMGGLVARYYLESGLFDGRPGYDRIRRLITLATPHRGAALALTAAMGLEKRLFLSADQVQRLANDDTFPSLYQLLPPADEQFAWDDRQSAAEFAPFPVYAQGASLGLNPQNLQAATDFRSKLPLVPRQPDNVRYFCFSGTRMPTLAHVRITRAPNSGLTALREELDDAGDGTVPTWSGGLPGVQGRFVGGEHGTIYKDRGLLRTLGTLLGKQGVLAGALVVRLSVRDKVATPRDSVHVVLTFPSATRDIQANLLIQQAAFDEDGKFVQFGAPVASYPVRYEGLTAETLGVTFEAPSAPGLYRVGYADSGEVSPQSADDFFVQSTREA